MVTSTDNWFRPSDICVGPDGSVYVADWYDPGVGGHGMGDFTRGRIYRLAPKGSKPSAPKVDLESKEGITTALASPNLATRYMAMAKIAGMDQSVAVDLLEAAATQKDNPWLRARALWQLGSARSAAAGQRRLRGRRPALPHPRHARPQGHPTSVPGRLHRLLEERRTARPLCTSPPRGAAAPARRGPGEITAAHLRSRQAIRRQGSLLSRSRRHRRRPPRQGPPRRDPGRLRQAVPGVERQGRRPRVGIATARDDVGAGQASRRQGADAGTARTHRGHPGGVGREGGRRLAAQGAGNRRAAGGAQARSSTTSSCSCRTSGPACAAARTWPKRSGISSTSRSCASPA